ncbi:hypothetical protein ACFQL1_01710 [Halomicroarcula sp. GCM10025709]|uniref:hypothetical protein n=1 Tax=Haloarcula TaxID=2237 RepID=UPI0024C39C56|nr:hypothetical protein [Halomicroarcula sp. YJ-61-S]
MRHERGEWMDCIRCRGTGEYVECYDDLCHAQDRCMHGNNTCKLCGGLGRITRELAERWRSRDAFEAVTAPAPDLRARGKLHQAAREIREDPERSLEEADF